MNKQQLLGLFKEYKSPQNLYITYQQTKLVLIRLFGEKPSTLDLKRLFLKCRDPLSDYIGLRFEEFYQLVGDVAREKASNLSSPTAWFDFESAYNELDPFLRGKVNLKDFTNFFRSNQVTTDMLSDQDIKEIFYELSLREEGDSHDDHSERTQISYLTLKSFFVHTSKI